MASVILKTAGAAVGNMYLPGIGGALLGSACGSLGNVIDNQLGLGTTVTGPRLENLAVQDSRYGVGIPIIYGNARVAGNIIWSTDLLETKHTSTNGGKGGSSSATTTKTYTYSVHCAVGICEGPVAGINTIWADSAVIYQNGVWNEGLFDGVSMYLGAPDQEPNSFMQSILGTDSVPAHRGLAYIVFDNLQLADFGNRIPNLTFEIAGSAATSSPYAGPVASASISQRSQTVQNGAMLPLVTQSNGGDVQQVLIGGIVPTGSAATFIAAKYDVTGDAPEALTSATSASFTSSASISDSAWALAPDGRFVACYCQTSASPSHSFALYDMQTQSFGNVLSLAMASSSIYKQIAWIDAQHFAIDDVSGGVRGLRVFARAGTEIIDLGFTGLWGSGSSSSTAPFWGAQFTPYADGLIAYNRIVSSKTLQARTVIWRNNQLTLGPLFTVASNLDLGSGSGVHARFLKTANGEWTLFLGTVLYFCALSFEPSASGATITRPWQKITQSLGTGTTNFPLFYGDRLLVVQNDVNSGHYLLSEVLLKDGGFSLLIDAAALSGMTNMCDNFCALRLDNGRLLFMAEGGSTYAFQQIAIVERNALGSVGAIVNDILTRAGYAAGDYDIAALNATPIQGYILHEPMSARSALEPLQTYAPFDLIETSGQIKAVMRGGGAAATIPDSALRAAEDGQAQPAAFVTQRAQEMDLPREVVLDVIDPARKFEATCQRARRVTGAAKLVQKIALAVVCTADRAKKIAETRLYTTWAERELVKISTSRAWLALDPADVVALGDGRLLRIAALTQSGGVLSIEGFYSYASSLESAALADTGSGVATTGQTSAASLLYVMDLPLLQASDNQPGVYVAVSGLAGWRGAEIFRSSDAVTYASIGSTRVAATCGMATTALADGSPFYIDNASAVTVQMTTGTLASCSEAELLNGANAAALGGEIVQFMTATLMGPGLYALSGLLRGRRGTESATASHAVGETFVLLEENAIDFIPDVLGDRNRTYVFRALSVGQTLSDAHDYSFTYGMKTLCPFAPVNIKGARSLGTSGDLTLTWVRRARVNAEWVDYIDVPLDETTELYQVDIMNGSAVARSFTGLTAATVTYTSAQQTSDWGSSIPSRFTVNVYQVSARYGNGNAGVAVV